MFYSKLVYTVASIDTQCIDSNLESGRYISRVGWASTYGRFLSKSMLQRYVSSRVLANQPRADRPDYESVL